MPNDQMDPFGELEFLFGFTVLHAPNGIHPRSGGIDYYAGTHSCRFIFTG